MRPLCLAVVFAVVAPAAPKLAIERLALHQFEDGPLLPSSYEFLPGETGWFSCRIAGFLAEPKEDDQHVRLSWEVRVTDAAGVLLEKPQMGVIDETLRSQDKDWIPKFLMSFLLPPFAPGGNYKIAVVIKDEVAKSEVAGELPFQVRGEGVIPSETFVIRNFRFFHQEEDTTPLRNPVYSPGAKLWARFEMAGYKFEANNRFTMDYGFAVLTEDGKELFALPKADTESDESFYPQRKVLGGLMLNLDANMPAGTYTVVVTARDQIGNQTAEQRETFRVEQVAIK